MTWSGRPGSSSMTAGYGPSPGVSGTLLASSIARARSVAAGGACCAEALALKTASSQPVTRHDILRFIWVLPFVLQTASRGIFRAQPCEYLLPVLVEPWRRLRSARRAGLHLETRIGDRQRADLGDPGNGHVQQPRLA